MLSKLDICPCLHYGIFLHIIFPALPPLGWQWRLSGWSKLPCSWLWSQKGVFLRSRRLLRPRSGTSWGHCPPPLLPPPPERGRRYQKNLARCIALCCRGKPLSHHPPRTASLPFPSLPPPFPDSARWRPCCSRRIWRLSIQLRGNKVIQMAGLMLVWLWLVLCTSHLYVFFWQKIRPSFFFLFLTLWSPRPAHIYTTALFLQVARHAFVTLKTCQVQET